MPDWMAKILPNTGGMSDSQVRHLILVYVVIALGILAMLIVMVLGGAVLVGIATGEFIPKEECEAVRSSTIGK